MTQEVVGRDLKRFEGSFGSEKEREREEVTCRFSATSPIHPGFTPISDSQVLVNNKTI